MASNEVLAVPASPGSPAQILVVTGRPWRFRRSEVGQRDDAVGIRVGQRIEQDGMDDTEHGGVRADPERHDENANQRRATIPAQRP